MSGTTLERTAADNQHKSARYSSAGVDKVMRQAVTPEICNNNTDDVFEILMHFSCEIEHLEEVMFASFL